MVVVLNLACHDMTTIVSHMVPKRDDVFSTCLVFILTLDKSPSGVTDINPTY